MLQVLHCFWTSLSYHCVIKIFVLSIFEWLFYTGFTVPYLLKSGSSECSQITLSICNVFTSELTEKKVSKNILNIKFIKCFYWLQVNPCKPSILLWDIGKQCIPRSDAAKFGFWLGSPLFAYRVSYWNLDKNIKKNHTQQPLKWKWTGPIDKCGKFHLAWMG